MKQLLSFNELISNDYRPIDNSSKLNLFKKKITSRLVVMINNFGFRKGSLKVYHCTSGIENPITWDAYCNLTIEKVIEYPCTEVIWYPSAKCRINILRNCIFIALYHLLPALFLQFWEKVTGKNRP